MNYKTMEKLNSNQSYKCLLVFSHKQDDPTVLTFSEGQKQAFQCKLDYFLRHAYLLLVFDYVFSRIQVFKLGQFFGSLDLR